MAAPELTPQGVSIQTFDEIMQGLIDGYKAIYGVDINLDQNTQDGQRIGIETKALHDLQQLAAAIYFANDPDLATGEALRKIIKLAGIRVRPTSQSQWDLQVTTDRALALPDDYSVMDSNGKTWTVASSFTFMSASTQLITFLADDFGSIQGLSGDVIKQATVILGVTSIVAGSNALIGSDEETDPQLRARRRKSVQNPSYSTTGGLYAKLANLAGVTDLEVYENDTESLDIDLNLVAHGLWVVIEGGDVLAIAETMAKQKTGGTPMKGSELAEWQERLKRADGSIKLRTHSMRFDRPTYTPVEININAKRKDPAVAINATAIADSIATKIYRIHQDVVASELYSEGYAAGNTFVLSDLEVSKDGIIYTDKSIVAGYDEKFTIDATDIIITEI